jgi:hypothetical protein
MVYMVSSVDVKIYRGKKDRSRYSINLPTKLVNDSKFPFRADEILTITIEEDCLIMKRKGGGQNE